METERPFDVHNTPNPNSVKVTTRGRPFIASGMESFRSAEAAAAHPLASSLFEVPGVADCFLVPAFVTVTKRPDVSWESVWPDVESRIRIFLSA